MERNREGGKARESSEWAHTEHNASVSQSNDPEDILLDGWSSPRDSPRP